MQQLGADLGTDLLKERRNFDGHLLTQVRDFGRLADKLDDLNERLHQVWGEHEKLSKSIPDFKKRVLYQCRRARRTMSPEVEAIQLTYKERKHHASRVSDAELERREHNKRAHREKYRRCETA